MASYINESHQLNSWHRVFLTKMTATQLVKKFPAFMEPKGSFTTTFT